MQACRQSGNMAIRETGKRASGHGGKRASVQAGKKLVDIILKMIYIYVNKRRQAGAELCQAQERLGLAKIALPVVVFHLIQQKLWSSFICQK